MYFKRTDQNYKSITDQQYADLILMRQNSFKNISFNKFLKLKTIFFIDLKHKAMTDQCGEVIGFLFREMLNELVDKIMFVKNKHNIFLERQEKNITSSHVFDAFRIVVNEYFTYASKSSFSKKNLFFR